MRWALDQELESTSIVCICSRACASFCVGSDIPAENVADLLLAGTATRRQSKTTQSTGCQSLQPCCRCLTSWRTSGWETLLAWRLGRYTALEWDGLVWKHCAQPCLMHQYKNFTEVDSREGKECLSFSAPLPFFEPQILLPMFLFPGTQRCK